MVQSKPKPLISFTPEAVPMALQRNDRWAPWRAQWSEKRQKYDKIPCAIDSPSIGLSTNKPDRWGRFDAALASLATGPKNLTGLGYCMTGPHGVTGVDLDNCVIDGVIEPWALTIVKRLDSYTELSPSGNGLRIMGLATIAHDWNNHEVGIEVYGGNEARFLTITGAWLEYTPKDLNHFDPEALAELARQYAKEKRKASVIDLNIPDILDDLVLPGVDDLPIPDKSRRFLQSGEFDTDRSGVLFGVGVALYAAGYSDGTVFSILANNEHAMTVALDHRNQDYDRALLYLWKEHCLKAKGKGQAAIASVDDFDTVEIPEGEADLPVFRSRDKNGQIDATIEQVTMAVRRADFCRMEIRHDQFRDEIMFQNWGERNAWRAFRDADYSRLRITLEKRGFKPIGREMIRDVVLLVADEQQFDSAIEWLNGLEWDGIPRCETFLPSYFGTDDTPYTRAVSMYTWTALAGRVLVPGVKADMVPILIGDQGAVKSTSVAAMVPSPDFFCEISFHEKDDDLARRMRGKLLAEIGELRGLHTRELESIKAFITRQYESWVPKYREFGVTYPRRLVFIGTTNQEQFLADETGNRRWLPVRTRRADIDAVRRDHLQLWVEAKMWFELLGVAYQSAEQLAKEVHSEHTITDPWAEDIARWLDEPDVLTGEIPRTRDFLQVTDVAKSALRIESRQLGKREEMRIANSLRELGFERVQKRINGQKARVWVRVEPHGTT